MQLTKHHGLANDFLVLVDPDGTQPIDAGLARAVCDRHRGIGADGLMRATPAPAGTGADVVMELRNADGSRAEMSGNGIRCLAQAVVDARLVDKTEFTVATDAGPKHVTVRRTEDPTTIWASVDMGEARLLDDPDVCNVDHARLRVDMGNPHVVLLGPDPAHVDVAGVGSELERVTPGGTNVEFVTLGPERDEITMRVWERGVGETQACGTGACAAAIAVHAWGRVGTKVTVHQPGGAAVVDLSGPHPVLSGPAQLIARIDWVGPAGADGKGTSAA